MKKVVYLFYGFAIFFIASCGAAIIVPIAFLGSSNSDPSEKSASISLETSKTIKDTETASLHFSGTAFTKTIRNLHLSGTDTTLHISGLATPKSVREIHLSGNNMDSHISGASSRKSFRKIHVSGNDLEMHMSGVTLFQPIYAAIHLSGTVASSESIASIPPITQPSEVIEMTSLHVSGSALTIPAGDLHVSGATTLPHISGVTLARPILQIHLSGNDMGSHISGAFLRKSLRKIHVSGSDLEMHVSGTTLFQPVNAAVHLSGIASTF